MTTDKIDNLFAILLDRAQSTSVWHTHSEQDIKLFRMAFRSILKISKSGIISVRKTIKPWSPYVNGDHLLDREKAEQSLSSVFHRLCNWHAGRSGCWAGTAFELREKSKWLEDDLKCSPGFADNLDTLAQVLVWLNSKGATNSVPGDQWCKALGVS